jgi:hypothetical protein
MPSRADPNAATLKISRMENSYKMKFGGWLAAAILAPFAVISAYLWVEYHFGLNNQKVWDWASIAVSVALGSFCYWQLPISVAKRVWWSIALAPATFVALLFYTMFFVCIVFGDCL